MHVRSRVFAAIGVIALGGLGNVIAQTDFAAPSTARQARGPRQHSGPTTVVVAKSTATFGDPIPGLSATQLAEFAEGRNDFQDVDNAVAAVSFWRRASAALTTAVSIR